MDRHRHVISRSAVVTVIAFALGALVVLTIAMGPLLDAGTDRAGDGAGLNRAVDDASRYLVRFATLRDIDRSGGNLLDIGTGNVLTFDAASLRESAGLDPLAEVGDLAWDNAEGGGLIVASGSSASLADRHAQGDSLAEVAVADRAFIMSDEYDAGRLQLVQAVDGEQAVLAVVSQDGRDLKLVYARRSDAPERFDRHAAPAVRAVWRATIDEARRAQRVVVHTTTLHALHRPEANMLSAGEATVVPAPPRPSPEDVPEGKTHAQVLETYYDQLQTLCDAVYDSDYTSSLITPHRATYLGQGSLDDYANNPDLLSYLRPTGILSASELNPGAILLFQTRQKRYALARVEERSRQSLTLKWMLQPDGSAVFPRSDESAPGAEQADAPPRADQILVDGLLPDASPLAKLQALARSPVGLDERQQRQMQWLLDLGVDPNQVHQAARTSAFEAAAMAGNVSALKILHEAGAKINRQGPHGGTALHFAAHYGHHDAAKWLLEHGADPMLETKKGDNALQLAVRSRRADEKVVELLREALAEPPDLFTAVDLGDSETVARAVQNGADPNTFNKRGYTPLHVAAEAGHAAVCRVLLEHGADPNLKTRVSRRPSTALVLAAGHGHTAVVESLLTNWPSEDIPQQQLDRALKTAVTVEAPPALVSLLLAQGAFAHQKIENQSLTALDVAMMYGSDEMVTALQEAGVQPSLWGLARLGDRDAVAQRLQAGAEVNAANPRGRTALHYAAEAGHAEIAALLLEAGADPDPPAARDQNITPLHLAAEAGQVECVRLLLAHGANVNAQKSGGRTPLYLAVLEDHLDAARLLLEAGADPNLTPRLLSRGDEPRTESLLDVANDNKAMRDLLDDYGAP